MLTTQSNIIYLQIAGFTIQLRFHPLKERYLSEKFIKEIYEVFEGFIVQQLGKKFDAYIEFSESYYTISYQKQNRNKHYLLFFEEKDVTIYTYYFISIRQLIFLITHVLQKLLTTHNGFFMHASASEKNGRALVFTGSSGCGKSTIMRFLHPDFPALADDTIIIKREEGRYFVYQTPYIEKNSWVKKGNEKYPLLGFYFLKKSQIMSIQPVTLDGRLIQMITKQIWTVKENTSVQFRTASNFIRAFHYIFDLYFPKKKETVKTFFLGTNYLQPGGSTHVVGQLMQV